MLSDRQSIHNIWEHDSYLATVKRDLLTNKSLSNVQSYMQIADELLASNNLYNIKLGMHIWRLCIWQSVAIANQWVEQHLPVFACHPHPRLRQTALWNARSAVWVNSKLSQRVLETVEDSLLDNDLALQRMSIWVHGDCMAINGGLLSQAIKSLERVIRFVPTESNLIFLLERVYNTNRHTLEHNGVYKSFVTRLENFRLDWPGLRARCKFSLCDYEYRPNKAHLSVIRQRLKTQISDYTKRFPSGLKIEITPDPLTLQKVLAKFKIADSFAEKIALLSIFRTTCWLLGKADEHIYGTLSSYLNSELDSDLRRTLLLILSDYAFQDPPVFLEAVIKDLLQFFELCDVDGSQIVAAQTLLPVIALTRNKSAYEESVKGLIQLAVNRSVTYAINCVQFTE